MIHKTSELTGAMLDAAVAKANGLSYEIHPEKVWGDGYGITIVNQAPACCTGAGYYEPSTDGRIGQEIIERERINLHATHIEDWRAWIDPNGVKERGETALIAAMRAFVAAKLGDEVDL